MIPLYEEFKTPIIMNIAGSTEDEYCEILELIELISSNIVGYEINISCPNVKVGGMEFGVDCELTEKLTKLEKKLSVNGGYTNEKVGGTRSFDELSDDEQSAALLNAALEHDNRS